MQRGSKAPQDTEVPPTSEAHMEECCDICGDPGVIDALVTCDRCKSSCEHLYCMRICRVDHPESWFCEKCEDLIHSSSLNTLDKLRCDSMCLNNLPNDLTRNSMDRGKKMKTSKVKPLSPDEVIMLASGAQKSSFSVRTAFQPSIIPHKRRSVRTPVKTRGIPPKCNSDRVTRNPFLEFLKQLRPLIAQQLGQSSVGQREEDNAQSLLKQNCKEHIQKEQPMTTVKDNALAKRTQITMERPAKAVSPMRNDQPNVNSGVAVSLNVRIPSADPRNLGPLHAPSEVGKCLYIPAYDASWKGKLNVFLNEPKCRSVGIQAHPSSRGRKKVYEASKLMPEVLDFEVVQRGSLWMSLFGNYIPDIRDIGLYFFPSTHERYNYRLLLEQIEEQDWVLRNCRDGLELLIFTSKVLHIDCQKWDGMYFFWGVFRRIKSTVTMNQVEVNQCHGEGNENEALEMEIDMIGGQNVGRLDIAVARIPLQLPPANDAHETFSDIPPGFGKENGARVQTSYASASRSAFDACVKVERPEEESVQRLDIAVPRISLQLPPANDAHEAFSHIAPGFGEANRLQVQTSHASASKSAFDACVKVEKLDEENVRRLDATGTRMPLQLPPQNYAQEAFSNTPPVLENIPRPQVQSSSAAKNGFGACVKVERLDEKDLKSEFQ